MDINHKKLIIYLIGVSLIFLAMCFLIGYFLGFIFEKPKTTEVSINECFIYGYQIPYIPEFQILGVKVDPTLYNIIKCESGFDIYAKNPKSSAKGLGQIIDSTFARCEKDLGKEMNVYNGIENLECCLYLYKIRGTQDWKSSEECWQ